MGRPIRETPTLYGEDARRFLERMEHPRKETKEERERRLKAYHAVLRAFEDQDEAMRLI